ncbi:MAG: ribosome maturation factor RimM [Paludibacter sp.]|nr:ribosome maturation factor RimM [Paludibacter sp.]
MILKENLFPIGEINKPHGVNGEMSFSFSTDVFDKEDITYFIIEMDGIPVPFFIEEYRFKTNSTGLLMFDGIDTDEKARNFMGKIIYLEKKHLDKVENDEIGVEYFEGFTLIDTEHGAIGVISEVDQTTENVLFIVEKDGEELLIPVGEDYVKEIDHENKILYVSLPEGLLEL